LVRHPHNKDRLQARVRALLLRRKVEQGKPAAVAEAVDGVVAAETEVVAVVVAAAQARRTCPHPDGPTERSV